MIDPQLLKTKIEAIEENIRKRDLDIDLDKLLKACEADYIKEIRKANPNLKLTDGEIIDILMNDDVDDKETPKQTK